MASVDIRAGWYLLCDRKNLTTIKYLWLDLHSSVNFTGKEYDNNDFWKFPFLLPFSLPFPFSLTSSYPYFNAISALVTNLDGGMRLSHNHAR